MIFDIHIGKNNEYKISYELNDNLVTRMFYNRMAEQPNNIIDNEVISGLSINYEEELKTIVDGLVKLGVIKTAADKNRLHENFPKYHDAYMDNPEVLRKLRRFNTVIHATEIDRNYENEFDNELAKDGVILNFTTEDSGVPLINEAYDLFELPKPGYLYMNYPHVGKHFLELALDADTDCPPEQIKLTNKMANGILAGIGGQELNEDFVWKRLEKFYATIADKLPYEWGDKRLAIGYLPLGTMINSNNEVIRKLHEYRWINGWSCS